MTSPDHGVVNGNLQQAEIGKGTEQEAQHATSEITDDEYKQQMDLEREEEANEHVGNNINRSGNSSWEMKRSRNM